MINWQELDLKGKSTGQIKIKCPACIERRSNKSDRSLSVNIDKGVAKCHYCEEVSIREFKEVSSYNQPDQKWMNYTNLSDGMVKYFKSRGISQSTLIECKITEEKYYQPSLEKEVNNIVFNYFEGDTLVNKKYRSGNKKFTQSKNTKNIFYGINDIIGLDEVYIVEGEIDKLSLWEIGIKNCISVPNGANNNDDVWINCERYFEYTKKFLIATDNDDKGNAVAEKIAQRLGRWRCERIQFKNKDANDDLKESVLVLEESLKSGKRYPVSGTFTTKDLLDDILELHSKGIPETISPKSKYFAGMENVFTIMKGHLITVTGIPSHGKSSFTDWYVMNLIANHGMTGSWFPPEHSPMA
jgi:twinkle protein